MALRIDGVDADFLLLPYWEKAPVDGRQFRRELVLWYVSAFQQLQSSGALCVHLNRYAGLAPWRLLIIRDALYILPTWKSTTPITKTYLKSLGTPVARIKARYDLPGTCNPATKNAVFLKSSPLPREHLLCHCDVGETTFSGAVE
jgi:hypothetical protein